jgi:hypothetical protein
MPSHVMKANVLVTMAQGKSINGGFVVDERNDRYQDLGSASVAQWARLRP